MLSPKTVIQNLLTPPSITLAQIAILEKITSPLITGAPYTWGEIIPSLYIIQLPSNEAIEAISSHDLDTQALAWAQNSLTNITLAKQAEAAAIHAINTFFNLLPKADETQKKKQPLTVSFSRWWNGLCAHTTSHTQKPSITTPQS